MKQAVCYAYGEPLKVVEDRPEPVLDRDHDLIVRIMYAGVNPVDHKLISGFYKAILPVQFPRTPGIDFSGVIEHSSSPHTFPVGSEVMGKLGSPSVAGTFAELVAVSSQKDLIVVKPAALSFEHAAGLAVCGMTAMVALLDYLKLGSASTSPSSAAPVLDFPSGETRTILIIGASGGVGLYAVQLAQVIGCTVIAVCSGRNKDLVLSLGATHVIDYTQEPEISKGLDRLGYADQSLDGILDCVGGDHYYVELRRFLKKGKGFTTTTGLHVENPVTLLDAARFGYSLISRAVGSLVGFNPRYEFIASLPPEHWPSLVMLAAQSTDGKAALKHFVHKTFDLDHVNEALKESKAGRAVGKILVRILSVKT